MKSIKDNKELWTIFLEHFPGEESFAKLVEGKRFASALSGVMKMIVDFHSLEDHKKRSQRMKQEAELLEKHKAYLRTTAVAIGRPEESRIVQGRSAKGGMQSGSEPQIDAGFMLGSARTGTDHYQLVQTEALVGSQHNTTKKNLPTYDLERILKLAEDAELNSKRRGTVGRRGDRGTSRSAHDIRLDHNGSGGFGDSDTQPATRGVAHPARKSSAGDGRQEQLSGRRERLHIEANDREAYRLNPRASHSSREDSPGLSPLNKLEMMREQMKRKKSGQTDSPSPSPAKEEEQKRSGFLTKMRDFDYSSLVNSKEPASNDYGFQGRQTSPGLKNGRDSKQKPRGNPNGAVEANQGLFELTDTDGERLPKRSVSPKGFDRAQIGQGTIDLAKLTWAREPFSKTNTQTSAQQPGKAPIVVRGDKEVSKRDKTSNTKQTPSLFDSTNKKLTPLVPESSKKDYFAKVEEERSKKSQKSSGKQGLGERSASESESRRLGRQRFHPPLDNTNPGYRSAFETKNEKQFVQDQGIPDYKSAISSSNYGKVAKSKSRDRSGSSIQYNLGSGRPRKPDTVKSLLNSILGESRAKAAYGYDNSRIGESSGVNRSRNNYSANKCRFMCQLSADRDRSGSAGSGRSNSNRKSDFGNDKRGDLYEIKKLDPLTNHQQKRHFPDKDQFTNSAAGGSSSQLIQ